MEFIDAESCKECVVTLNTAMPSTLMTHAARYMSNHAFTHCLSYPFFMYTVNTITIPPAQQTSRICKTEHTTGNTV